MNLLDQLRSKWASARVHFNPGVNHEGIVAAESLIACRFPPTLRDFYRAVNGMPFGKYDGHCFRFLPLEEAVNETLELRSLGYIDLLMFGEFTIFSHEYVCRFGKDGVEKGIEILTDQNPIVVCCTFQEFLLAYLNDELRRLYIE